MVAEIALAVLVIAGGGLFVADFIEQQNRGTGLDPVRLLSLEVPLATASGPSADRRRALVADMIREVGSLPGVEGAAITTANPFSDRRWGVRVATERSGDPERGLSTVNLRLVTPNLFRTWRTPVLAGRDISSADRPATAVVAVVSRRFARRFWPGSSALQQRLYRRAPDGSLAALTVVGVVGDVRDSGDVEETVYLPYEQLAGLEAAETVYLMVRGSSSGSWAKEIPRALSRVDPRLGVAESGFMDALWSQSRSQSRAGVPVLAFLGGFALLLSSTGIFAIVSFAAVERRSELGIRVALGATPASVRRLIVRQGSVLALAGCAAGLPLALAANRVISSSIKEIPDRPFFCGAVALVLFLIASISSDVPARRAARRSPLETLGRG